MYCSIGDITKNIDRELIIQLVNDENRNSNLIDLNDATDVCVIRINEAIKSADNEIDGYIRSKYSLPLPAVPEIITDISCDISIYNLYKRRHRLDMPESLVNIYKQRTSQLKEIQKGFIDIGLSSNNTDVDENVPGEIVTNKTAEDRVFSKDILMRY